MIPTAGIGFKPEFFEEAIESPAAGLWFEVHAENYMVAGGPRLAMLEAVRTERPVSLHGVGMSLCSAADVGGVHLARLKNLVERIEPFLLSEHLAWSHADGFYLPDLLPIPRTRESLECVTRNIDRMQTVLGRQILIENPSHYIALPGHEWEEPEFLAEIVRRTGCGLLVDVNNVWISANNLGYCPYAYLDALAIGAIGEIHIAGHTPDATHGEALLIDSHDAPITETVWSLLDHLVARAGAVPILIERDGNVPPFTDLMVERNRAVTCFAHAREHADAI